MASTIALFAAAVAALDVVLFLSVPAPGLSLSLTDFAPIALLSFPFVHFDYLHLVENLVGLILTAALAIELDVSPRNFIIAFFAGAFIAVPLLALFPTATIAGSSTGIFGSLAAALARAHGFIRMKYSYPAVVVFVFGMFAFNWFSCAECAIVISRAEIFHLAGFGAGAAATFTYRKLHL